MAVRDVTSQLRHELDAATPDVWATVRRRVAGERVVDLLAAVAGPPAPGSRLHHELRFRLQRALAGSAA